MIIQGKWALVTGASSGIGEQFARQLAKQGSHLILVARSESKLESLASELRKTYGIKAEVVSKDLSKEGAPSELYQQCRLLNVDIELLVNNAGFATHGLFEQVSGVRQHEELSRFLTRKQGLRLVGSMLRPREGSGNYKNTGNQSDLAGRTIQ